MGVIPGIVGFVGFGIDGANPAGGDPARGFRASLAHCHAVYDSIRHFETSLFLVYVDFLFKNIGIFRKYFSFFLFFFWFFLFFFWDLHNNVDAFDRHDRPVHQGYPVMPDTFALDLFLKLLFEALDHSATGMSAMGMDVDQISH
jgi:hypothetical protein